MRILRESTSPQVEDQRVGPLPQPSSPVSKPSDPVFLQQVTAVLTAVAAILATRLLLLLARVGSFVLAYRALSEPDWLKLAVCVVYNVGVILPVAFLYLRGSDVSQQDA